MSKSKFTKPPLSETEKEKRAEEFLNYSSRTDTKNNIIKHDEKNIKTRILKKEPVKSQVLRFPMSLAEDIAEISAITGLSMNAICVELLRPAVKAKLKEIKE